MILKLVVVNQIKDKNNKIEKKLHILHKYKTKNYFYTFG